MFDRSFASAARWRRRAVGSVTSSRVVAPALPFECAAPSVERTALRIDHDCLADNIANLHSLNLLLHPASPTLVDRHRTDMI